MNTSAVGELSESRILAFLLDRGFSISIPWGNTQPYDLILDAKGRLWRVQVKTGKLLRGSVIRFNCHSKKRDGTAVSYHGRADLYAVYCPQDGQVYIVPVDAVGITKMQIRTAPAKNKQRSGIRASAQYSLEAWMVSGAGLEPATSTVSTWRSNQTELTGQIQ